jgi:hypothetical protein
MNYTTEKLKFNQIEERAIEDLIEQIKSEPKQDLVSVIGKYEFDKQIIYAENIVFHDNSELIFTDLDLPYVILACKNLKFNAPLIKSTIKIADFNVSTLKGIKGDDGNNGSNGASDGRSGQNGGNGAKGADGATQEIPDLYLFVDNVATDHGEISTFDWQIKFEGIEGGEGGKGGNGRNGGNGARGRKSASGPFFCKRGAQRGGNGGNGGKGGQGGDGGDGSEGATVYLISNESTVDQLVYAQYHLNGGDMGDKGVPGTPGNGGAKGQGGKGTTHCSGGKNGSNGSSNVGDLGNGSYGLEGKRGEIKIIEKDLNTIF